MDLIDYLLNGSGAIESKIRYIEKLIPDYNISVRRSYQYPIFPNGFYYAGEKILIRSAINEKSIIFGYVPYLQQKVSVLTIQVGQDALSTQFTGCMMAKFRYKNSIYVSHIHCSGITVSADCKQIWANFLAQDEIELLAIFSPGAGLPIGVPDARYGLLTCQYWGIIDSKNNCYSIQFHRKDPGSRDSGWIYDAIYLHDGMKYSGRNKNAFIADLNSRLGMYVSNGGVIAKDWDDFWAASMGKNLLYRNG